MYLTKIQGRKSKALKEMINEPMIIELKNGEIYGGMLDDEPECGIVSLHDCQLLEKKGRRWIAHDVMMRYEGKVLADPMPDFSLADIKNIFVLPKEQKHAVSLDDVLQIYIDPHFTPLIGVNCRWNGANEHSFECDRRLHEALSVILMEAHSSEKSGDRERERKLHESFSYLRNRLITYGARIP